MSRPLLPVIAGATASGKTAVAVELALPALIGLDGIGLAIVVAEALALLVTAAFLAAKREYYHYG